MGADLRNEFEEYVKKLTTAICKDILLEKMEELYDKYESGYEKYGAATSQVINAGNALKEETQKASAAIKKIDSNTKEALARISTDITGMEEKNAALFMELREWNLQNKQQLIRDIELAFEKGNEQVSDRLAGIITVESLQEFVETIEENTRKSHELVTYINDTYEREIEENIKRIIEDTKRTQETVSQDISAYVKKVLEELDGAAGTTENKLLRYAQSYAEILSKKMTTFHSALSQIMEEEKRQREIYLEKQIEVVKQIGPSDEKIRQLTGQVVRLEQLVAQMERKNEENISLLRKEVSNCLKEQKEIERRKQENQHLLEKKAESISWKIYTTFVNTLIVCLLGTLITLLEPWEVFGREYTLIICGVILAAFLLVMALGKWIARVIAKHQMKKYAKKFEG